MCRQHLHNHNSTGVTSGVTLGKKFPRSHFRLKFRFDFGIRPYLSYIFKEKYSRNHRGHPSTHGSPIGVRTLPPKKYRCPEKFFCDISRSNFCSSSLISWSFWALEDSISPQGSCHAQCAQNQSLLSPLESCLSSFSSTESCAR